MNFKKLCLGLLIASSASAAFAQDAMLRLRCEGEADGADIYINGQLKGQCPTDLSLAPGQIKLKVQKNIDTTRFKTYEREFLLSSGALKRLDVELGAAQFTAEGQRLENIRLEAVRQAAEQKARQEAAERGAARLQAERDAPRLAAEKRAADAAAAEAARRAEPGYVKNYMAMMSTNDPQSNITLAPFLITDAPLFLPMSTTTDKLQGKDIALSDPATFGNPDSMIAKAVRQQQGRQHVAGAVEVAMR